MEHRVDTRRASSVCLALALLVVGCSGSTTQPDETPVYSGTTCAELAKQWGEEVDRRITAIIDGPEVVNGQAKSAQNTDALVLPSTALSVRLADLGMLDACDMPEFLPIAEREFSDKLRSGAGTILYDADPVATYDDWHAKMESVLLVIDSEDTD